MHESIMDVDWVAALSLPSVTTESANVASATEGAAPNKPAKLFGLKTSPSSAKVETDIPPMMKRIRISFIMPRQIYPRALQSLPLKAARHLQAVELGRRLRRRSCLFHLAAVPTAAGLQRSP